MLGRWNSPAPSRLLLLLVVVLVPLLHAPPARAETTGTTSATTSATAAPPALGTCPSNCDLAAVCPVLRTTCTTLACNLALACLTNCKGQGNDTPECRDGCFEPNPPQAAIAQALLDCSEFRCSCKNTGPAPIPNTTAGEVLEIDFSIHMEDQISSSIEGFFFDEGQGEGPPSDFLSRKVEIVGGRMFFQGLSVSQNLAPSGPYFGRELQQIEGNSTVPVNVQFFIASTGELIHCDEGCDGGCPFKPSSEEPTSPCDSIECEDVDGPLNAIPQPCCGKVRSYCASPPGAGDPGCSEPDIVQTIQQCPGGPAGSPCDSNPCPAEATCDAPNSGPGFACLCPIGFAFNGTTCNDINECAQLTSSCSVFATCINTVGSFNCTCQPGFFGDGKVCSTSQPQELINNFDKAATEAELANGVNSAANTEKRESLIESVKATTNNINDTLAKEDLESLADIVTVAVRNSNGLSVNTRKDTNNIAQTLIRTLGEVQDKPVNCGSATSCLSGLTCHDCPARCGPCFQTAPSAGSSVTLATQFRVPAARHGTGFVTLSSQDGGSYEVHTVTAPVLATLSGVVGTQVVNPVPTKPKNQRFSGVSFVIKAIGSPATAHLAVEVDLQQLAIMSGTVGNVRLASFNTNTRVWEAAPESCGAPHAFNATSKQFTGTVCSPAVLQYALFILDFAPDTSVETKIVESLAGTLFGGNIDDQTALAGFDEDEKRNQAKLVNDAVRESLQQVSDLINEGLEAGDPAVQIVSGTVKLTLLKAKKEELNNVDIAVGTGSLPRVATPATLSNLVPANSTDDPTLQMIALGEDNLFAWAPSAENITGMLEINLKVGNETISVTDTLITIKLEVPAGAKSFQVECKFFDVAQTDATCTNTSDAACQGVWDTTGLVTNTDSFDDGFVICETTHLTAFGVDADLTLAAPDIGASNFTPSDSWIIYTTFSTFYAIIFITFLISRAEERAFDAALEENAIVPKVDTPRRPTEAEKTAKFFLWFRFFRFNLRTRHLWLATFWPRTNKHKGVIPRRFLYTCLLWASVSLGFGVDALFTYTATANAASGSEDEVNTLEVRANGKTTHLPMEGVYTFMLSFPLLVLHSFAIGYYKKMDDKMRFLQAKDEDFKRATLAPRKTALAPRKMSTEYLQTIGSDNAKVVRRATVLYRICLAITLAYVTIGFVLALAYVGSLNHEQQYRWFFNALIFLFAGVFIAAPGILGFFAYHQMTKMIKDSGMTEELLEETCTDMCMSIDAIGF